MILTPKGATWKLLIWDKETHTFSHKNEKYQLHQRAHMFINPSANMNKKSSVR